MVQEQTVNKLENAQTTPNLTPAPEALRMLWVLPSLFYADERDQIVDEK